MADPVEGRALRHLIFDFFGTLVTYQEAIDANPVQRARAELSSRGIDLPAQQLTGRLSEVFASLERGANQTLREYSMADAVRLLFDDLGVTPARDGITRFVEAYLADWSEDVLALPRLVQWLGELPASKSVLSNTHHEPLVVGLIERIGVTAAFERVTTSIGHGYRKPHGSIYRAHLDGLGLSARDVVFVGDNPQCDYFGPRSVGIESFLIASRAVSGVPEKHRLSHLYELTQRLE